MRKLVAILCALIASGCASTAVEITPVHVEPVQTIKSEPFDPDAVFDTAKESFASKSYLKALKGFNQVLAYDPERLDARFWRAETYLAMGDYNQAADIYWSQDWSGLSDDLAANLQIGMVLSGVYADKFENPVSAIHDAMTDHPNDPRLWNAKGQHHDRRGEWMDALSAYIEAMKSGKWQAGTINNMGMSLLLQGRIDEAKTKFEQAHNLLPDNQIYENNMRMSYILLGDLKKALNGVSETRAANILNDAGFVALSRNKNGLAKKLFEKALETSPVFHAQAQANLDSLSSLEAAARSKSTGTSP